MRDKPALVKTKFWDDCGDILRTLISNAITFDRNEEPVLVYYEDDLYWWLLTNDKLIINNGRDVFKLNFSDIKCVEFDEIKQGRIRKELCTSLQLITNSWYYVLKIEERSWPIIYNLLKFVIAK